MQKKVLFFLIVFPIFSFGQTNLSGVWKIKEKRIISGATYVNAVPTLLGITQVSDTINIHTTYDLGNKDTTTVEILLIGAGNEGSTINGKHKTVSFVWQGNDSIWKRSIKVFSLELSNKVETRIEETFQLLQDGTILNYTREYDGTGTAANNKDFKASAIFEKTTLEKLALLTKKNQGVRFEDNLSWEAILTKARAEGKFVLIDCYATWCVPCKTMDKEVFALDTVAAAIKAKFIALKVQMDSTIQDPLNIRQFYTLARELERSYSITALPTYLVLSPEGKILHKQVGASKATDFLNFLNNSQDSTKQLYTIVNKARRGGVSLDELPSMIDRLIVDFKEKELANEIAQIYKRNYLDKLSETELLVKQHLDFIGVHYKLINSQDNFFKLCQQKPDEVDRIKDYKGWADFQVTQTIKREDIDPFLEKTKSSGTEPNWKQLHQKLKRKYGKRVGTTYTLDARVFKYYKDKEWTLFSHYLPLLFHYRDVSKIPFNQVNSYTWAIYSYCEDLNLLEKATLWIEVAIANTPKSMRWMTLDTKACLLYKLGRTEDAIAVLKGIVEEFPNSKQATYKLEKILKGEKI